MGKRREGREVALQLLFHWDLNVQQPVSRNGTGNLLGVSPGITWGSHLCH